MRFMPLCLTFMASLSLATAANAQSSSATTVGGKPSLEELIQQFHSEEPPRPADVQIDAWIESAEQDGKPNTFVITIQPGGDTKLNADPGVTVTPADQGLNWQHALPHRHVDGTKMYFDPPATIAMPFTGTIGQPVEVLVEYAYCFVDFQCFFGEETLRVSMTSGGTG